MLNETSELHDPHLPMTHEIHDAGCICKGNWRAIVRDAEPLLDQRYSDENGDVWTFFGLVHARIGSQRASRKVF